MEITGTIYKVLDPVSGESDNGFWMRRGVVLQPVNTQKKVCIEFSGEDWSERLGNLKEGDMVKVNFAPESNEFEGKWYTRLKGYAMRVYGQLQQPAPAEPGH